MPTQDDIDSDNTASKNRQRESRAARNRSKDIRKERSSRLRAAESAGERREIKNQYQKMEGGVWDVSTSQTEVSNNQGKNTDISSSAGVDSAFDQNTNSVVDVAEAPYAFKVVDNGDGTVSVTTGTVNTDVATGLNPSGKPTELWLKVTFNASSGEVTSASVRTANGGTSATQDYRQIASITWDGDVPTIVQGIKGSQSIASCGATHQWGTLYS